MWTRTELKSQAKNVLKDRYWTAFLVCLIIIGIESAAGVLTSFIPLAPLAVALLIMPVLVIGQYRWFSRGREAGTVPAIDQVFSLFRGDSWGQATGSMLWMYLFLFLWSLLAIIPSAVLFPALIVAILFRTSPDMEWSAVWGNDQFGILMISAYVVLTLLLAIPAIIKGYSYRMVPWILADNPGIGYQRSLKLSIALTREHRWNMFVLDLSFLGWYLLGLLACGIGVLFVAPYYLAVYAELYASLRRMGVDKGLCTMEELGFVRTGAGQA